MSLPATATVNRDTVDFIRLGYDGAHCLDFTVSIPNWETFVAALTPLRGYNEFDGPAIVASFRPIWDMAMQVEVGRDASACLYVTLPFWKHQRHDTYLGAHEKYTDEQRQEMAAQVIAWARTVKADIVRVWQRGGDDAGVVWAAGDSPTRIRVWWD